MDTDTLDKLDRIIIEPEVKATACVIWLHGLGADGHDFEPIVPTLNLPADSGIRFIFPHAPKRPVTINQGAVMRAWYDLYSMDLERNIDRQGIDQSSAAIEAIIAEQLEQGMASERIVLAGFSQGGVMALHIGLRYPQRLAGILALSCYLASGASLAKEGQPANQATPVFISHGEKDNLLPVALGEMAVQQLKDAGYPVSWAAYPMAHELCYQQIVDISHWLQARLLTASG
jgi:phospholipase/carboxylesterase